jgi:simple sugar transport system substrate-binding protein
MSMCNPGVSKRPRLVGLAESRLRLVLCVALVAASLALAACGESANKPSAGDTASAANAQVTDAASGKPTIYFIYHAPASNPFSILEINGMNAAASQLGVNAVFRGVNTQTFQAADEARLISDAVAAHPAGIITTDPAPTGLNSEIRKAVAAKIPVILVNQGQAEVAATGALGFVGQSEQAAGQTAGKDLCADGVHRVLWVTIPPGAVEIDAREAGLKQGLTCGQVIPLIIPTTDFTNPTYIATAIEAEVTKDPGIDGVMIAGSGFLSGGLTAENSLGSRAKKIVWTSFDTTVDALKALDQHKMAFLIDQQPWMQGYLSVVYMALHLKYGMSPPPVSPTGPQFIGPAQAASIIDLVNKHIR